MKNGRFSVQQEVSVDTIEDMREFVVRDIVNMSQSKIKSFDEKDLQRLIAKGHKSEVEVFINPDTFGYTIENHDPSFGFDIRAVYPLMTNSIPSEEVERGFCYVRKNDGDFTKIEIESLVGDNASSVKHIHGLPVINDDDQRLCFKNPKSGSDTIHVARLDEPSDSKLSSCYSWSVCGFGSSRKSEDNAVYVDKSELDDEYITTVDQNGGKVIVGKLCGRCRKSIN